jgi:hypothetical protein
MGTAVRLSGESTGPSLPVSLKMAVRQEFARALQAPYETFITVAVNGDELGLVPPTPGSEG